MKKIATTLLLALLLTSNAYAEQIPDGCYVAFNNPGYCYQSNSGYYEWEVSGVRGYDSLQYGYAFEALLHQWFVRDSDATYNASGWIACTADYNNLAAERNSISAQYSGLANSYNNNEINRQQWIAYAASQEALLKKEKSRSKKLKKACGSACSKIK